MSNRLLPILLSFVLALGCRSPVAETGGVPTRVTLTVELPAAKSQGGQRQVLVTPSFRSRTFTAQVTGAGYGPDEWLPVTPSDGTTGLFADDPTLGNGFNIRSANMQGVVPGGARRIFKVKVWDDQADALMVPAVTASGVTTYPFLVDEMWGVADMEAAAGAANEAKVNQYTTPTAKIFHKLIQVDAGKALTVDIKNVQALVNKLTNTDHRPLSPAEQLARGYEYERINPNLPRVSPAVIDIDQVAAAIVRGNNGLPFQVPEPVPQELLLRQATNPTHLYMNPAAKSYGKVRLRVLDLHGDLAVGRPILGLVSDPASVPIVAPATAPVDITFPEVAPGRWMVEHTDMERGGKVGKLVDVPPPVAGVPQTAEAYTVAYPTTEHVAGYFDADNDAAASYNDEDVAAKLAYLGSASRFHVNNGVFTFTDATNHRVRRFDLNELNSPVRTVAGSGVYGHRGDGSPANLARIQMDGGCGVAVDRNGVTYFIQNNDYVRAVTPSGVIRTVWQDTSGPNERSHVRYDPDRHELYYASRLNESCVWDNPWGKVTRLVLGNDPNNPVVTGAFGTSVPFGGDSSYARGLAVSGDYAFGTVTGCWSSAASISRYPVVGGGGATLVGGTQGTGDDKPGTAPLNMGINAGRVLSMDVDHKGNLFYASDSGMYRVTRAADPAAGSSDWLVKRLLFDGSIRDVGFDRVTRQLYILTSQTYTTPSGPKAVAVFKRVVR